MIIFDANMILRYLINDNPKMAEIAENYLNEDDVSVTIEVIAEVIYVLKGVYSMERKMISETLASFMKLVNCRDKHVLNIAINIYSSHNLDFVDCVLYGYYSVKGIRIATFDKKLLKLMDA